MKFKRQNLFNDEFYHYTNVEFFGKMIGQFSNYNNCIHKKSNKSIYFIKLH